MFLLTPAAFSHVKPLLFPLKISCISWRIPRAVVASKTDEGADVARHFVSPMVLRALVDKLASYKAPAITGKVETSRTSSYKYAAPSPAPAPAPAPVAETIGEHVPPPTVTEDLVIKLLACLMVHPQQGQRARLVLRDEVPETVYMALHQAGSVPADIKGDSSMALPPLPHRDTDHKLYPKKGKAGAGALGAGPALATGGAKAPTCLENPLNISIVRKVETSPVTVENVEVLAGEADSISSGSPKREASLARSVVAALTHHRGSPDGRTASVPPRSVSGKETGVGSSPSRSKGLWQRASASWATSALNPAYGISDARASSPAKVATVEEVHSPEEMDATKSRTLSMRMLATRLSPRNAAESTSPGRPASGGVDAGGPGTVSPASGSSPSARPMSSPKPSSIHTRATSPKPSDGSRGF